MADVVWADVVALQATLSTVAMAAQTVILDYVNNGLNPTAFGGEDSPSYTLARAFLAAHLAELIRTGGTGATGAVSSETISTSSISISYATSGDALMFTRWGSLYAEMLSASALRLGFTNGIP